MDILISLLLTPPKSLRKAAEQRVREVSGEKVGNIVGFVNNVLDSKDNLQEGIAHRLRLKKIPQKMTVSEALKVLKKGDHIKVMRSVYSHHAIYMGKGKVNHYDDFYIHTSRLADFADGALIIIVNEESPYSRKEIVRRAKSRLGEARYNPFFNNCESYATWCRCGGPVYYSIFKIAC